MPSQLLFVDLDGDGLDELVSNRVLYREGHASMGIYTRRTGAWQFLPQALEFDNPSDVRRTDAQAMTAADVNADGLLDLYVAGYETDQSRATGRFNRIDAHDGADNLLFINHGDLRFTEESDARGITGTQYTYVAQFFDFDADGDPDLFEGNDFGRNVVWDNPGRRLPPVGGPPADPGCQQHDGDHHRRLGQQWRMGCLSLQHVFPCGPAGRAPHGVVERPRAYPSGGPGPMGTNCSRRAGVPGSGRTVASHSA